MIPRYLALLALLCLWGCNTAEQEPLQEDYRQLFPFTGIDKPERLKGNLMVRFCDPELALENYKYPGESDEAGEDEYTVTLTCTFDEFDDDGNHSYRSTAQYEVRYINEHKELVTITCDPGAEPHDPEEDEEYGGSYGNDDEDDDSIWSLPQKPRSSTDGAESDAPKMRNGEVLTLSFKVRSGFPMYLSVNGIGPRGSDVKASIKAVSTDGLIEIPELKTELYQHGEGPRKLLHPYCEYIILP